MKRALLRISLLFLLSLPIYAQRTAPAESETSHATQAIRATPSAQEIWATLMDGNKRFVSGKTILHDVVALRKSLASGQHPNVVVLSCSDSRVPPEVLFDQSLGDLFVVRSAGNIADAIGVGSIEYAVEHLGSSVLVVLGHTKCGAVTAACSGDKMPTANLRAIVDQINPAVTRARKLLKGDALIEAAIQENVHQSAKDVVARSEVLQHFVEQGNLSIVEAEYQVDTGEVTRLDSAR